MIVTKRPDLLALKVRVTRKNIDDGVRYNCRECPVAAAIEYAVNHEGHGPCTVYVDGWTLTVITTDGVWRVRHGKGEAPWRVFLKDFDAGVVDRNLRPLRFDTLLTR